MMLAVKLGLAVSIVSSVFHGHVQAKPVFRRAVDFFNPVDGGGSMLSNAGAGGGEPLNVIVSGLSSPEVLTDDGFLNFAKAIGFSTECLGVHLGDPQSANLGDGYGPVNQTVELRQDFGDPNLGTCLESLVVFAVFITRTVLLPTAVLYSLPFRKKRQDVQQGHTIVPDGYDIGRDELVTNAVGTTSFGGVTYSTISQTITGLLPAGSDGINHGIAIDGNVVLLTITIQ
ncbi:hypothetical protein D9613_000599 [Agrocybe pediades]|uniref:Uncharacterized protein n=1 Tax=Agrocybe pediades TaxID=84607 RepID=A0A8H4R0N4_9AGAR|nr:hypothetical protein D9613_000599 [Agrocybe pediades]